MIGMDVPGRSSSIRRLPRIGFGFEGFVLGTKSRKSDIVTSEWEVGSAIVEEAMICQLR